MSYIYRVYNTKTIGFFNTKDDAISLLYHINNAQVEVFSNLTPIGNYKLHKNQLYFNNTKVELEGYMKSWFSTPTKFTNNDVELNLFIPLSESNKNNNVEIKDINMDELAEKIRKLEEEAKENEQKANEIKEVVVEEETKFLEKRGNIEQEKKRLEKEKDKWLQFKNKLEADKRVYCIIKEQLESGELAEDNIPILFQDKYPIFKYMHQNNKLNLDDALHDNEINSYLEILNDPPPDLPCINITTNVEDKSYSDLFSSGSDPLYIFKKNIDTDLDNSDSD